MISGHIRSALWGDDPTDEQTVTSYIIAEALLNIKFIARLGALNTAITPEKGFDRKLHGVLSNMMPSKQYMTAEQLELEQRIRSSIKK